MSKLDLENLTRGASELIGWDGVRQKIQSGKKLHLKHGWDPTAADLHLGYAVAYRAMRRFQDLGHSVVFLVGDFTARIGDPTGKDKTRPTLSKKEIDANVKKALKQVGKILDLKKTEIRYNSEWWDKMKLEEFLKIARLVSSIRLFERDLFQERIKKGNTVFTHELLYPILQGYDSVMLKSDLTIIGNDQIFNELFGRDLQEQFGQEPQAIMAMPLLIGTDGKQKMSQSLGNYIGIAEPAKEQYGKIMSVNDNLIIPYFQLLTDLPQRQIQKFQDDLNTGANPRDIKMVLAKAIVSLLWKEKKAQSAQNEFIRVFQAKEKPSDILAIKASKPRLTALKLLIEANLALSKSEARRLIEQEGVKVNDEIVKSPDQEFILDSQGLIVQKGKRSFVKVFY